MKKRLLNTAVAAALSLALIGGVVYKDLPEATAKTTFYEKDGDLVYDFTSDQLAAVNSGDFEIKIDYEVKNSGSTAYWNSYVELDFNGGALVIWPNTSESSVVLTEETVFEKKGYDSNWEWTDDGSSSVKALNKEITWAKVVYWSPDSAYAIVDDVTVKAVTAADNLNEAVVWEGDFSTGDYNNGKELFVESAKLKDYVIGTLRYDCHATETSLGHQECCIGYTKEDLWNSVEDAWKDLDVTSFDVNITDYLSDLQSIWLKHTAYNMTITKITLVDAYKKNTLYQQKTEVADGKYSERWVEIVPLSELENYDKGTLVITRTSDNKKMTVDLTKYYNKVTVAGQTVTAPEGYGIIAFALINIPEEVELSANTIQFVEK
ncbi:MAG: hypothetical protein K5848_02535 [Lachnospiraceae bacterium]|nr:hypothetical protein [Lachnospiraceae bacterium]